MRMCILWIDQMQNLEILRGPYRLDFKSQPGESQTVGQGGSKPDDFYAYPRLTRTTGLFFSGFRLYFQCKVSGRTHDIHLELLVKSGSLKY